MRREGEGVEVGGERKRGVASEKRKALVGGAWGEEGVGRGVGGAAGGARTSSSRLWWRRRGWSSCSRI